MLDATSFYSRFFGLEAEILLAAECKLATRAAQRNTHQPTTMNTYGLKFDINKPIAAKDIQDAVSEVDSRLRQIRRKNAISLVFAGAAVAFGVMLSAYNMRHSHASVILSLLIVTLAAFSIFKVIARENLKKYLQEVNDSLLPAHTELVAERIDYFMQNDECRRYIQNVAEQHRQLLFLEVYGMQDYCCQLEAAYRLALTR